MPIYWLNGNKVADDYADFYDGSWDDSNGVTQRARQALFFGALAVTVSAAPNAPNFIRRTIVRLQEAVTSARADVRQRVTKGAGSRTKGLLMAYKLLDMAQRRWRRLNGAHLLPLVRAGVVFIDGVQKERNNEEDRKEAA